jgi:hypothetical protein
MHEFIDNLSKYNWLSLEALTLPLMVTYVDDFMVRYGSNWAKGYLSHMERWNVKIFTCYMICDNISWW